MDQHEEERDSRLRQLEKECTRSRREAVRSRAMATLIREGFHLVTLNISMEEIVHRFLRLALDTLRMDRAAILEYSPERDVFEVQASIGVPGGKGSKFTLPERPEEFLFLHPGSPADPLLECLGRMVGGPNFLWAFDPETRRALLLGTTGENRSQEILFDREDREIAVGTLKVFIDITEQKRAKEAHRKTRERLELALQGADLGMWDWNNETNQVFFSDRWVKMLGYTTDEIEHNYLAWKELVHPEDLPGVLEILKAHLQGKTRTYEAEFRLRTKSGSWKWILARGKVVEWDVDGRPLRSVGTHLDIDARMQAEAILKDTLAQLENSHGDMLSILNQLSLGTALFDERGRITFLSRAAARLTGLKQEEVLNLPWERVLPFQAPQITQLKEMLERPAKKRSRVSVAWKASAGRCYRMDVEIQDHPWDPRKKIFCLYDTSELHDLRDLLDEKAKWQDLIGKSKPMRLVFELVQQLCRVDTTVLIEGDTGTGKELVARALHFASSRRDKPFVAVHCSGLTESVLHSQLFGHRRGAFTGAIENHRGVFEAADGGTVFLDEIAGVSMTVQANLLRVLEEREITPLGTSKPISIDIRIIVATNKVLSEEVDKHRFRPDLFYRIRVARIQLPALRSRREDIPLLARDFLRESRAATGKPVDDISPEAMKILLDYRWPGNVRELKNAIEFATIRCKETKVAPTDLPPEILETEILETKMRQISGLDGPLGEKERLLAALESAGGNRTVAARLLGISRATFYRRLEKLNMEKP